MPSHFKFLVTRWPNSDYLPGDVIGYEDLLNGMITGGTPAGARVLKVASGDHEFEVVDLGSAKLNLVARSGRVYEAKPNQANTIGVTMSRRAYGKKTSKAAFADDP
jgi:hypothetical protein